ncbi:MAG: type pilus biosis ATPase PilM [Verrucomicrobiota bacterium]|jgi:type IV pilus assembly protein PilM
MGLPFLNNRARKRDQIISIDLGGNSTKAVALQRKGDRFSLTDYAVVDSPKQDKPMSSSELTEHLKQVMQNLDTRQRQVTLCLGVNESVFRQTEVPFVPVADLRQMLKYNAKNYLQQDYPDHVFDCHYLLTAGGDSSPKPASGPVKHKVVVGGARRQSVENIAEAIKGAGLIPDQLVPGLIGPVNAFELSEPEAFANEVFALVDMGFRNTSIVILAKGQILLNRVVAIGGDHLTAGLADTLNISYQEAENIKVGMPTEVQQNLEPLLQPLGRELRASIDFFEHQQDKAVAKVYVSGGPARSEFLFEALQAELLVPCQAWSPTKTLNLGLKPQKLVELEQIAPQLAVAIGAAAVSF